MGTSLALSVVIPTRNRQALLLRALRALANQTLATAAYEVVVVVDGSTDGTSEAVGAFHAPYSIRVIDAPGRGRAAACNAGIREAAGGVIVMLDDDMVPSASLLEAHLKAHRTEQRLGVVGPVPIELNAGSSAVALYVGTKFNRHLARLAAGAPIGFHDLYTGNFSIRRSLLDEVGLFDEAFTMYGNEDGELGLRLLASGVHLTYAAGAVARQSYTKSFAALANDNEAKGRTAVILARKHPSARAGLRLSARSSRKRRIARGFLFAVTKAWAGTPRLVVAAVDRLGQHAPRLALRAYPLALDYFYWRGARAEGERSEEATLQDAIVDRGRW